MRKLKEGDALYLKIPNKPMGLFVNDIYGEFLNKIERMDSATDTKIEKFMVKNIKGEIISFSREIFEKWFSNEPIDITKIKKTKPKVSMEPTKVVRRKA